MPAPRPSAREAPASPRLRGGLLAAAAVLLLAGLDAVDLWAPDEPRYAQVAEELRSGEHGPAGLVLLHLNGEPYTQKPPLWFWLAAGFGAPFGRVTELAARLPSALAGVALVALTAVLGARLLGAGAGLLGAALLLTTFEFAHLARRAQLDPLLALLETAALAAYVRLDRGLGRRTANLAALHAALGLAVLTKGPVGLLVPVLVMALHLAWERRLREIVRVLPPWALVLSLGPGLAWLAAALALAPPGTFGEAVGANVFGRFFAGTSHERPFYYYLYQFPVDALPWTALWPAVALAARRRVFVADPARRDPERARAWRFLLAWLGASLLFFSLSAGKRGLYLLPAFPAAALLCADACRSLLEGRTRPPRAFAVAAALGGALLAALGAACLTSPWLPVPLPQGFPPLRLAAFGAAALGIAAAARVAWALQTRHRAPPAARLGIVVAAALGVELAVFLLVYPGMDAGKSARPVALAAADLTDPGRAVGLLGDRALAGGLVYYGRRPVALLSTPESVERYVAGGGRAIVVQERKLARVEAVVPVRVAARFREGRRSLVVVTPAGPAPPP
jgi:4-amino-4-deoxy-L-arabinose transferase-like glycosyltransferase